MVNAFGLMSSRQLSSCCATSPGVALFSMNKGRRDCSLRSACASSISCSRLGGM